MLALKNLEPDKKSHKESLKTHEGAGVAGWGTRHSVGKGKFVAIGRMSLGFKVTTEH